MSIDKYFLLQQAIEQNNDFVIIPHINPDGDALGSSLGLKKVLELAGKCASVVSPNGFPDFPKWLPGANQIVQFDIKKDKATALINNAQVIFFLDFNTPSRLKELAPIVSNANAFKIMIDHHPYPEDVVDVMFSDVTVSSTCELVFQVLQGAGMADFIDKDAAESFYTGIITDTGGLSYNSSNPETYYVVASLLKLGIDKSAIHERIFNSYSYKRMQMLGYILSEKMERMEQQEAAYITLSKSDMGKFDSQDGDTEGFVNYPLSIAGVNISAFFNERDNIIKLSFRSRGEFPVNKFSAAYFGGGGHKNAAGGEFKGTMEEALAHFKNNLPIFFEQWRRREV